jgi:hypothetical protein
LISGRAHFAPVRKTDKKTLDREVVNYDKFVKIFEKEEHDLINEVNRTSDPLYLSKLDDAIRGYKARNHKAKNYN